jgi:hypothetical protein
VFAHSVVRARLTGAILAVVLAAGTAVSAATATTSAASSDPIGPANASGIHRVVTG